MAKSIVVDDMEHCYVCGSPYVEVHHCIGGRGKRDLADKYGLTVALCRKHHTGDKNSAHSPEVNRAWKERAQKAFEEKVGTREEFIQIFGKSYILD